MESVRAHSSTAFSRRNACFIGRPGPLLDPHSHKALHSPDMTRLPLTPHSPHSSTCPHGPPSAQSPLAETVVSECCFHLLALGGELAFPEGWAPPEAIQAAAAFSLKYLDLQGEEMAPENLTAILQVLSPFGMSCHQTQTLNIPPEWSPTLLLTSTSTQVTSPIHEV